jgi:hypothetical protein
MKDAVDHVIRPAPPWRAPADTRTECGRAADSVEGSVLTRDEFISRWREQGQRRAALTTCMACIDAARRWSTWDEDPVSAVGRETHNSYGGRHADGRWANVFRDELIALAELVDRHPEEFDEILAGLRAAVRLDDRRKAKAQRRRPGA